MTASFKGQKLKHAMIHSLTLATARFRMSHKQNKNTKQEAKLQPVNNQSLPLPLSSFYVIYVIMDFVGVLLTAAHK